jgi:hypothetical protein
MWRRHRDRQLKDLNHVAAAERPALSGMEPPGSHGALALATEQFIARVAVPG